MTRPPGGSNLARPHRMSEVDQYDYDLPPALVAQHPLPQRVDARLMVVDRDALTINHYHVRDLPDLLRPDDCLVLNDTRVLPARLVGRRTSTGGRWEGLFLEADPHGLWRLMGKTRGHLAPGERITLLTPEGHEDLELELVARADEGAWIAKPGSSEPVLTILERIGRVPLPPYIRKGEMVPADREHYQTVFARRPGAVAAPTAGLHFTEGLLARLAQRGVGRAWVTLHVGAGTFRPISTARLADHLLHSEWAEITADAVDQIQAHRQRGGRVVAVGTTAVRVLETAAANGTLRPFQGTTSLFIRPPYHFRAVDALMTNFHLPRSTLLVLVRTFGGDDLIRRAYEEAIREEYRFYSYGDAMLIL